MSELEKIGKLRKFLLDKGINITIIEGSIDENTKKLILCVDSLKEGETHIGHFVYLEDYMEYSKEQSKTYPNKK